MKKGAITLALAGALLGAWALPVAAQDNGIVIENNGVDNMNSAAGADNVRISRADGNSSANNGGGTGNEVQRAPKEPKERNRRDRGGNSGEAAPVEAAPADGGYEAYAGEESYDPNAVAQEAPANLPIQLPNTGAGVVGSMPWAAFAAMLAAGFGTVGVLRRRAI